MSPDELLKTIENLARRIRALEVRDRPSGGGGPCTPDASVVTYTPNDNTDWNGGADPGNADDAFDQLADRVDTLEGGAGHAAATLGPGSDAALALVGQQFTLADVLTPAEHTAIGDGAPHHAAVTLAADVGVILGLSGQEITLDSQNANTVLAGPTTGAAADPTFRSLVAADVGSGAPDGTKFLRDDMSWQATGGGVATDPIWDAAGDLAQGTGANAAAKLSLGTAYQHLSVNSGATAAEWTTGGRFLISEQTPTSTGTVTWNSIPATYKSLYLEWIARTDYNATTESGYIYFNNDTTAANYKRERLQAADSTGTTSENDASDLIISFAANTAPANSAGQGHATILNYAATTFKKVAQALCANRSADGTMVINHVGVEWESTVAITRIDIVTSNSGNFVAGSTFRLYGVM